jgi:hypothetical protein
MKTSAIRYNCWRWLLPVLAILLAPSVMGQGTIVYVHAPLSNPNGDPNRLPWDSLGTQVGPDFPIVINGQTAFVFSSGTRFAITPTGNNAVLGFYSLSLFGASDATALPEGFQIGPDTGANHWTSLQPLYGGLTLAAARDGGIIGEPPLTSGDFVGVESAYIGILFYLDSQAHFGWIRAGSPVVSSGSNGGWVYDFAYETSPNAPIFAGAVPEPSMVSLLLVSGAAFWLVRKRF